MVLIGGREIEMNYYAKGDGKPFYARPDEIAELNESGHDIYWTPQEFTGERRVKEELKNLRFVFADFDDLTKEQFMAKMKTLTIPTMVVRTRGGFHAYWMLEEYIPYSPTLSDYYKDFIGETLVPLGADPNAKDVCRMSRAPMMRYWRDSKGNNYRDFEIYIQIEYESQRRYDFDKLQKTFRRVVKEEEFFIKSTKNSFDKAAPFWRKANSLDPQEALQKLSGSSYVKGERFSFKKAGKLIRIHVNGEPTNAWIDEKNTIGSMKDAGPSIVNWLGFYGHSMGRVAEILKENFKELHE